MAARKVSVTKANSSRAVDGKLSKPAMRKPAQATARFKYVFPQTYNPVYANGAVGGVGPQGDIVINFYHERQAVPYSVTHKMGPDGTVGDQIDHEPRSGEHLLIRYITTGVAMNESVARRIYDWLGNHLRQLDALNTRSKQKI